jgi:hypothetical protein
MVGSYMKLASLPKTMFVIFIGKTSRCLNISLDEVSSDIHIAQTGFQDTAKVVMSFLIKIHHYKE